MSYILMLMIGILWCAVAHLCVYHFNEPGDWHEEWRNLPLWVRLPMWLTAPIWFLWWSR